MGIKDILKKKQRVEDGSASSQETAATLGPPQFTFIRSDTYTQEIIHPPSMPVDRDFTGPHDSTSYLAADAGASAPRARSGSRLSMDFLRRDGGSSGDGGGRSRSTSVSSARSNQSSLGSGGREKESVARRLSHRLHLSRNPSKSDFVPQDLPEIVTPDGGPGVDGDGDGDGAESQWEKRATILALENEKHQRGRPGTPVRHGSNTSPAREFGHMHTGSTESVDDGAVSSKAIDQDIQEAIHLHEEGDLERSTALFGQLADPNGPNNPLSQVLYGLALRHGWGCAPDPAAAVNYLSAAASNAAEIETLALQAGLKKGGAAKGELVLAIFELANCFRHGWGIPKDPVAAKQYYETAANLGDTDAMNEVAWCYLEGFGTKKDKFAAAKYYRLAEENGNKTIGNSWIWKDKYDPGNGKK